MVMLPFFGDRERSIDLEFRLTCSYSLNMSAIPTVGAFAIVPNNDLHAAIPFWERLGFSRTGGEDDYVIMTGWGCEVHLIQAGDEP